MSRSFRPLYSYLQRAHLLGEAQQRIQEQRLLLERVRRKLKTPLPCHCLAVVRNGSHLTLFASSSAWATRLRFESPHLLRSLPGIHRIQVRILPVAENRRPVAHRGPAPISARNAHLINATADSQPDPQLAAALRRLASHSETTTN